ncbi:uncharacterized protein LOC114023580 [Vombatus ursinus]|uniref:uncharacterized protein LOC114023580 n=1 Tax=Vombatus ursinus TaxID=29139 RepID=UPI000FFD0A68|nr:uncharacterized protein LOC114023580 [Vombatus ursinus]
MAGREGGWPMSGAERTALPRGKEAWAGGVAWPKPTELPFCLLVSGTCESNKPSAGTPALKDSPRGENDATGARPGFGGGEALFIKVTLSSSKLCYWKKSSTQLGHLQLCDSSLDFNLVSASAQTSVLDLGLFHLPGSPGRRQPFCTGITCCNILQTHGSIRKETRPSAVSTESPSCLHPCSLTEIIFFKVTHDLFIATPCDCSQVRSSLTSLLHLTLLTGLHFRMQALSSVQLHGTALLRLSSYASADASHRSFCCDLKDGPERGESGVGLLQWSRSDKHAIYTFIQNHGGHLVCPILLKKESPLQPT